jgi:hypothetical protein
MNAISSVSSQPPAEVQQAPQTSKAVDRDGDHDNNAPDGGAAAAQSTSGPPRALNTTA